MENWVDFKVVKAPNAIRPGIAAVSARIESGRLRIVAGQCPNLLVEAGLYRYDPRLPNSETPIDEHNHTLDALRYLIYALDSNRPPRRPQAVTPESPQGPAPANPPPRKPNKWLRYDNEALWTRLG